jgi:hypothetical protein
MNPDYQKEMEEKAKRWEEEQKPYNDECVRRMRSLIPPDIIQSDFESLMGTCTSLNTLKLEGGALLQKWVYLRHLQQDCGRRKPSG